MRSICAGCGYFLYEFRANSITAMAGHVLATALAPTFALAGHSMGGRVALEVIEHCGHMPTVEQPSELNRALLAWLQG
jgi:pimeloyl-ACP methyl ester carboxylesterase